MRITTPFASIKHLTFKRSLLLSPGVQRPASLCPGALSLGVLSIFAMVSICCVCDQAGATAELDTGEIDSEQAGRGKIVERQDRTLSTKEPVQKVAPDTVSHPGAAQRTTTAPPGAPAEDLATPAAAPAAPAEASAAPTGAAVAPAVIPALHPVSETSNDPACRTSDQPPTTYQIRLPLAATGSILPKIPGAAPAPPQHHHVIPPPIQETKGNPAPLAWRATAQVIRAQAPGPTLSIVTVQADYQNTCRILIDEARARGWMLSGLSLPAGHILLSLQDQDDAAGVRQAQPLWLILTVSPFDQSQSEVRAKIQGRHAARLQPTITSFLKRCQELALSKNLL